MLRDGAGCDKNERKAMEMFEIGTQFQDLSCYFLQKEFIFIIINCFEAIFDLGKILLAGVDGEKDENKALSLFEFGASLNDDDG